MRASVITVSVCALLVCSCLLAPALGYTSMSSTILGMLEKGNGAGAEQYIVASSADPLFTGLAWHMHVGVDTWFTDIGANELQYINPLRDIDDNGQEYNLTNFVQPMLQNALSDDPTVATNANGITFRSRMFSTTWPITLGHFRPHIIAGYNVVVACALKETGAHRNSTPIEMALFQGIGSVMLQDQYQDPNALSDAAKSSIYGWLKNYVLTRANNPQINWVFDSANSHVYVSSQINMAVAAELLPSNSQPQAQDLESVSAHRFES